MQKIIIQNIIYILLVVITILSHTKYILIVGVLFFQSKYYYGLISIVIKLVINSPSTDN